MLDVYNTENSVLLAVPHWILSRARAHFLYNMHTAYKRQYPGQYTNELSPSSEIIVIREW